MSAGELRDQVTFQTPTQTVGAGGQPSVTWADHRTHWADIEPDAMTENEKNDRPQAVTNWKAKIRYDATITNQMRMVHDSHTIEITGLTWDKRRIWMHLRGVTEN